MVTKSNYDKKEVNICLSVIVEIMTILGSYRDNIVLIGGWVPYFILDKKGKDHIGNIDIDLGVEAKIVLPDFPSSDVKGIDILEGNKQPLVVNEENNNLVIKDLVVRDYPTILYIK